MNTIKTFDVFKEIIPALDAQGIVCEINDIVSDFINDCAISWHVGYEYAHDTEIKKAIDKYLLSHGAENDERVFLWISW